MVNIIVMVLGSLEDYLCLNDRVSVSLGEASPDEKNKKK